MLKRFAAGLQGLRNSLSAVRGALTPGHRNPSDKERRVLATLRSQSIRRELDSRSAPPLEHEERQQLAYWRLWRSIRHAAGEAFPPETLNPSVWEHVSLALSVVCDYNDAREEPGPYVDCLYRPVADLPYPQSAIRRCSEFLIQIADANPASIDDDRELLTIKRDVLGVGLFSLDYFLDAPASELPREKAENLAYVQRLVLAAPVAQSKPSPGDVVITKRPGVTELVNEVIGVGENDEWVVLTKSGASMQVRRGAESGSWEEINEVAAGAASWLTLTPTAGVPRWAV